ncbi:hypothetical protein [Aquimarina longa]|uniref:hypothetical protein n=2 Tax=Aquimarina longa TaxID=1080221 RepID=UPI0007849E3A|nr:hypothetical protein [Aquimarina longa]
MKTLISTVLLLCTLTVACQSNKSFIKDDLCGFNDPIFTISDDEKTFDVEKYREQLKKRELVLKDNDTFKTRFYMYKDGEITNKQTNKQTNIAKWILYKKKGTIKRVRFIYLNSLLEIGKETNYDTLGNISKVIDHEKGYTICWAEAIEIVKDELKEQLAQYDSVNYVLQRPDLNRTPDAPAIWSVGIAPIPDDNNLETIYHKIDGVTGKYLGKYTVRMVHDLDDDN